MCGNLSTVIVNHSVSVKLGRGQEIRVKIGNPSIEMDE